MIRFKCAECGAAREVPDEMGGRKLKCQDCKQTGHVPEAKRWRQQDGIDDLEEVPARAPASGWPTEARVLVWVMLVVIGLVMLGIFCSGGGRY